MVAAGFLSLAVALALGPVSVRAADIAVGVRAGDPTYRELRLAADLGLLDGPLTARRPLSRADVFRLLRPGAERLASGRPLPGPGTVPSVRYRMDRLRWEICPWDEFWARGEYPVSLWGWLVKSAVLEGSDIRRGSSAPHDLDQGTDRTEGVAGTLESRFFVEAEGFAIDYDARIRSDRFGTTWRPLTFTLRSGWRNLRVVAGREPLSWGPGVHGNLLLTTNAEPLNQLRLESDSPFALPGPFRDLGRFTVTWFAAHLDDPHRHDAPSPWLTGSRATWSPARWFDLGISRTVLLGGHGHGFIVTPGSLFDVLTGTNENRRGGDRRNDTDQLGSVDWNLYLWPALRPLPLLDGGRLYGEYGGEDSPQSGPLPSTPGHTYGIELVARGVLVRAEASNAIDDSNLWYWHYLYTDGYTLRGRVIGHPMGGDSRAQSYDLEVPVGEWGLVTAGMERQEHGFRARPGIPPIDAVQPVPHGVQDTFSLALEKYLGPFPGAIRVEGRALREWGDPGRLGPLENWGVTVEWRR